MTTLHFNGKQIYITTHTIKRVRSREIAFPDQVYNKNWKGSKDW